MKTYRARYTPEAARITRKLHPTIKVTIRTGIRDILKDPLLGRELQLELSRFRSLRVRRYRIICRINEEQSYVEVHYVGPRRDVYESLRELLSGKERK
ncbi:MAG TPA: type II toxin-antitoxin system RelE/ParE family toxin [Candidatus Methylomirabilis sp.]|nr:type II toxin-antitoxin system RelE/ParE family toxin [Candidatus Methylomirabilis sp.]